MVHFRIGSDYLCMHNDDLAALLKRYHEGLCNHEERMILEHWYDRLNAGTPPPDDEEISASLEKVLARVMEQTQGRTEMRKTRLAPVLNMVGSVAGKWKAVAAAVLVLGGAYWAFHLARIGNSSVRFEEGPATTMAETNPGEVRRIWLPDGSVVVLNANSQLSYPVAFERGRREIRLLQGEAFFQVAPDPSRPFIVRSGGLSTTVLGTSFNIRSYSRDTATVLSLLSGKVSVSANGAMRVILAPGELIIVGKKTGGAIRSHFDNADAVTDWQEKAIHFQDASFEDIAFELENTYGIRVENASTKKHWSYTGYFAREDAWEIIRTICITENLDFRAERGQAIFINKK